MSVAVLTRRGLLLLQHRFAEGATIAGWLRKVQDLFQQTAAKFVASHGWTALFRSYDTDGR